MQGAGTTHTAHHFVQYQQDLVALTDLPDPPEISGDGRNRAERCPDHRLGDESRDVLRTHFLNRGFQLVGNAQPITLVRLTRLFTSISETSGNVGDIVEQRQISLPPSAVSTD